MVVRALAGQRPGELSSLPFFALFPLLSQSARGEKVQQEGHAAHSACLEYLPAGHIPLFPSFLFRASS